MSVGAASVATLYSGPLLVVELKLVGMPRCCCSIHYILLYLKSNFGRFIRLVDSLALRFYFLVLF